MAERPRPLGPRRALIDAIEHAGIVQVAIGGGKPTRKLLWTQPGEHGEQRLPMGTHAPVAVHHLIENAGQRAIAR